MYEPIRTKSVHTPAAPTLPQRCREEELDIQLAGHLAALLAVTDELRGAGTLPGARPCRGAAGRGRLGPAPRPAPAAALTGSGRTQARGGGPCDGAAPQGTRAGGPSFGGRRGAPERGGRGARGTPHRCPHRSRLGTGRGGEQRSRPRFPALGVRVAAVRPWSDRTVGLPAAGRRPPRARPPAPHARGGPRRPDSGGLASGAYGFSAAFRVRWANPAATAAAAATAIPVTARACPESTDGAG